MATKEELQELLNEAREKLKEQDEILQRLTTPPLRYTPVISVSDTHCILGGVGNPTKVFRPESTNPQPGDFALVNMQTNQIVEFERVSFGGQTHVIKRIIDERYAELDSTMGQSTKIVIYGCEISEGDTVVLDSSGTVVLKSFGRPPTNVKSYIESPVTWDHVGGLDHLKKFFQDTLEAPFEHHELYKFYNLKPPKGVLMFGPPGCGKTLIAKAVAHSINNSVGGGFISLKGPEVLAPFVGMAEATVRTIFQQARDYKAEKGFPAIIFIDEAEAILNRRGSGVSSDVDRTIVPAFLAEMDGVEDSAAIVLLATNRPEMLDPAVVREGRIDKKVKIPRPTRDNTHHIFKIHLSGVPLVKGLTHELAAEMATEFLFHDKHILADVRFKDGMETQLCLRNIVSGAMIAAVVQSAAQMAFSRDLEAKKPTGVTKDLIEKSIKLVRNQNSQLDHIEDVKDLHTSEVQGVTKVLYEVTA